jgi:hypothetical protein
MERRMMHSSASAWARRLIDHPAEGVGGGGGGGGGGGEETEEEEEEEDRRKKSKGQDAKSG